jgi:hypothetical protein
MPRIKCPKNEDCYIDCPGSGYAYYIEPYGPCTTGCDQSTAGDTLVSLLREANADQKFSGVFQGVTSGVIAKFARDLVAYAPESAQPNLARLQNIDILEDTRRITASWEDVNVHDLIQALANAAFGGETPAARAA